MVIGVTLSSSWGKLGVGKLIQKVRGPSSGPQMPGFEFQNDHFTDGMTLISLCLSFSVCKVELLIATCLLPLL